MSTRRWRCPSPRFRQSRALGLCSFCMTDILLAKRDDSEQRLPGALGEHFFRLPQLHPWKALFANVAQRLRKLMRSCLPQLIRVILHVMCSCVIAGRNSRVGTKPRPMPNAAAHATGHTSKLSHALQLATYGLQKTLVVGVSWFACVPESVHHTVSKHLAGGHWWLVVSGYFYKCALLGAVYEHKHVFPSLVALLAAHRLHALHPHGKNHKQQCFT
jgi:hypothetical protein